MEIHHHDDAGFDRNSKQCDVAHPDGDAEVVAKPILENQAASHRVKRGENKDGGFSDRVEDHIKKQEDHKKHDRHDELQPFLWRALRIRILRTTCKCTPLEGAIFR